ncbi:uncharacterized protein PHACADRAFT_26687 [Phanerochaete carnosa HHB-10118-sp]|uniref:DUF221-domain-containing protein n=1 Tax=Phanerochaete carnosa (strain HHB-10118-sp) TaxID=650164 RepID=K5V630_PHACS|nr:uncharacterized protein PHACADRAFT_26687 [Phanerochaete carnosa HHB-10118-sp]EKM58161.1 hypothetical protein PHACADRAFT_26687 [Phanerochaete carnosa HHB-10118-sp]
MDSLQSLEHKDGRTYRTDPPDAQSTGRLQKDAVGPEQGIRPQGSTLVVLFPSRLLPAQDYSDARRRPDDESLRAERHRVGAFPKLQGTRQGPITLQAPGWLEVALSQINILSSPVEKLFLTLLHFPPSRSFLLATMSNSSSPSISNAASASTSTFTTALVFNAAVFGAELAVFTLVRPYFPAIYQPRTSTDIVNRKRSPPLTQHLLWPLAVFRADYTRIKDVNGLDAYFFVRFLRMVCRILFPVWVVTWIILLPIDAIDTDVPGRHGLDKLSFGNVAPNRQDRYAAHLIVAYLVTFWVCWNVKHEMANFINTRQRWLISPGYSYSARASTVLIRGVPQRYLTERALKELYDCLPGGVAKVWLNRDLKDMPDLYKRQLKACNKLESAETSLLHTATKRRSKKLKAEAKAAKKGKQSLSTDDRPLTDPSIADTERNVPLAEQLVPKAKRPTHRLPLSFLPFSLPLIGKEVDSIEWARAEIVETSAALRERRIVLAKDVAMSSADSEHPGLPPPETNHPDALKPISAAHDQTYPPLNSAFILFNRQIAAHLAAQALTHHSPYRIADRQFGVAPEDVIWANLNLNPYEARIRIAVSWGITLGLIILWAFPVAFVGAVSNIHALCMTYKWLAWICTLPSIIVGIISGILPPVLLAVLMMMLPIVLRLLSRLEGTPTRTGIELSLMTRYFLFEVLHSFLIVTLSSGIIAALPDLVNDPSSVPSLLAQNLPKASNFFLSYIILQGLSGSASGLLQVVSLVLYYFKLYVLGSTPRSIYKIKYTLRNVSWGTLWPSTTLLVVITLAYSVISPIINGLAWLTFFLFYQLWKYQFLYQLEQPESSETGGLFFPKAIQHVFVGMYIMQICLAALFFLAQNTQKHPSAIPEGALMVVLIAFTAFFNIIINNSYSPLVHALPLSLADKTGGYDLNREAAEQDLHDNASTADGHSIVGDDDVKKERAPHAPIDAVESAPLGESKASASSSPNPADDPESNPETANPPEVKPVDEDAGPKEFYHPASVEPQRIVWIPEDQLGLAAEEEREIRDVGIRVSTEGAIMNEKGHVDIDSPPPGGDVRAL